DPHRFLFAFVAQVDMFTPRLRQAGKAAALYDIVQIHRGKTPLAVLKTQAAVALASQHPHHWYESLQAMSVTLDSTIQLTE
ncbi:hypothetical protein ONO39_28030, partial [Salmonella enterica subsp. enterica serovar Anatum]|nr:hypothetical protein [Salmonella enterica subsp. enterica serovar Anatum]